MTTRHDGVASHAKHISDPHKLRFLRIDESRMLLQNKVFDKEICSSELKDVSERISQKYGGLPLSIVPVAAIVWISAGFIETHAKKLAENYLENLIGRSRHVAFMM